MDHSDEDSRFLRSLFPRGKPVWGVGRERTSLLVQSSVVSRALPGPVLLCVLLGVGRPHPHRFSWCRVGLDPPRGWYAQTSSLQHDVRLSTVREGQCATSSHGPLVTEPSSTPRSLRSYTSSEGNRRAPSGLPSMDTGPCRSRLLLCVVVRQYTRPPPEDRILLSGLELSESVSLNSSYDCRVLCHEGLFSTFAQ